MSNDGLKKTKLLCISVQGDQELFLYRLTKKYFCTGWPVNLSVQGDQVHISQIRSQRHSTATWRSGRVSTLKLHRNYRNYHLIKFYYSHIPEWSEIELILMNPIESSIVSNTVQV